jgi:hypothetical protein
VTPVRLPADFGPPGADRGSIGVVPRCLLIGQVATVTHRPPEPGIQALIALVVYTTARSSIGNLRNGTNSAQDCSQVLITAG